MLARSGISVVALTLTACATQVAPQRLDGYAKTGDANWSVVDNEATATSGSGISFLVSPADFRDFELELEVYVGDPHNSGVFIRCADRAAISATTCYEINIYDKRPDQSGRTGAVPGFFTPPLAHVDAAGKWNTLRITAKGPRLTVLFNNVLTVDADGPLTNAGAIALQWGEGDVRFRNLRVKPL